MLLIMYIWYFFEQLVYTRGRQTAAREYDFILNGMRPMKGITYPRDHVNLSRERKFLKLTRDIEIYIRYYVRVN